MFPISDVIPSRTVPVVTIGLISLNALAFLYELQLDDSQLQLLVHYYGVVPATFSWADVLSSMFLHGGWLHFLGNMLYLWIFGDNVEDRLGRLRFAGFYLLTGVVGALAQTFLMPDSRTPMIGASGAVAGVLGGYVLLFPGARIVTLVFVTLIPVPAWVFLGIWFVGQFLIAEGSGIAWMAHVGGFLAGLGLVRTFVSGGSGTRTPDPARMKRLL
jgi:membrane associated rhomboid family serine protease